MTDLDTDTARIVTRLAEINAQVANLNADAEALKAELRSLPVGEHSIGGRTALRIIPNRRFDAVAAASLLDPAVREQCLSVSYDAALVKRHLTPDQIDAYMVEVGKPKVTLA